MQPRRRSVWERELGVGRWQTTCSLIFTRVRQMFLRKYDGAPLQESSVPSALTSRQPHIPHVPALSTVMSNTSPCVKNSPDPRVASPVQVATHTSHKPQSTNNRQSQTPLFAVFNLPRTIIRKVSWVVGRRQSLNCSVRP